MIQLVVFDMAGTTVYDGDAVNTCLRRALASIGVVVSREDVNRVMGLPKPVAIRGLLTATSSAAQEDVESMAASAFADFQRQMIYFYGSDPDVRPIDGAERVFQQLKEHGIIVALDTGFTRHVADAILNRLGWNASEWIDVTVTSDEVANGRPYPDLIIRAMELAGVSTAANVAKVGDTPSDLLQGTAAGCSIVIGVTQGSHTVSELAPYPHTHLVNTVGDVPPIVLNTARNLP